MSVFRFLPIVFFVLFSSAFGADLTGEGASAFRQGNYQKAADAFTDAAQKSPDDLRIIFNRGASLAASGKFDEAVEALQKSAVAKDSTIAAKSLTLLGNIAVDRIKQLLAEKPTETPPSEPPFEKRKTILDQLLTAEKYYTESLALEPSETIRTNLEQIRAWKTRTQAEWEAADRSQKRTDDVSKRLQWLEDWEGTVKNSVRKTNETPDSPKKFQTFYESAQEQNCLAEEIAVLKNDFQQKLSGDNASEENRRAADTLSQEFDGLQTSAKDVAALLRQFQGDKALESVGEISKRINRLRMNLAPFEVIVQEAEKKQETLCNENPANAETQTRTLDITEQARQEQTIADWMPLMIFRAKQGLEAMNPDEPGDSQRNLPQNTEELRKAMDLAVQTGPEIQTLAEESARLLTESKTGEALPKQQETLQLLRDILKQLQKDQQQNQQQDQQGQQGQDSQQDQDQKSQQNSEQKQQKQEQQKNQEPKPEQSQEKQTEPKSEPQQQKKEFSPQEKQEKNEEREKAERMLRQVKRRQQEANDKRERVRALLMQSAPVEKDW